MEILEYLIIWFEFLGEVLKGIVRAVSAYILKRTVKATLRRSKQKGGFRIVTLHSIYGKEVTHHGNISQIYYDINKLKNKGNVEAFLRIE